MMEWLFGAVTVSVLLTLLLQLVPEGNVKKAVSIGFGFVFLAVIISPLTGIIQSVVRDAGNSKILSNLAYSDLIAGLSDIEEYDAYTEGVVNEYVKRLQNEVDSAVRLSGFYCESVVMVNRDIDSADFGRVISVVCNVSRLENSSKKKKGIVKPVDRIEKIVIGTDGVEAVKPGDEEDKGKDKEAENSIKKTVSFILDIDMSDIQVEWN